MVVPMEQWAGQPFQDKSADLWVVMLSDHNEKYSDRMERSYKVFAVTFELRFPFPLSFIWQKFHFYNSLPFMAVFHYLQSFHITGQLWEESVYQWITVMLSFHVFFAASLNKLLNKVSQ